MQPVHLVRIVRTKRTACTTCTAWGTIRAHFGRQKPKEVPEKTDETPERDRNLVIQRSFSD